VGKEQSNGAKMIGKRSQAVGLRQVAAGCGESAGKSDRSQGLESASLVDHAAWVLCFHNVS